MPYYSDSNYYYSGGSSQLYSPYYPSGLYSTQPHSSLSSSYSPYGSAYSRTSGSSYLLPLSTSRTPTYTSHTLSSRYQPKLSTITEIGTSRHTGLIPLTRTQSPKISSYTPSCYTSKYVPPRPISINTADLDVSSSSRCRKDFKQEEPSRSTTASPRKRKSIDRKDSSAETVDHGGTRSTIKRDRAIVRLSTVRSRSGEQSFQPEVDKDIKNVQTDPSLFRDLPRTSIDTELSIEKRRESLGGGEEPIKPIIVDLELDPIDHTVRRLSIPFCPSFHDICEDISSDKLDDDLNAGDLRRRASIIQEQEQELLNQLQKSASGTFQLINLERRDSHDSLLDEAAGHRQSVRRKSKKGKKIRHRITAVVGIDNAPPLPVLQEKLEELATPADTSKSPKPRFTFNVETVEEHEEINKIFRLPKKRASKKLIAIPILPDGFVPAIAKPKPAKHKLSKKTDPNVFIFDHAIQERIEKEKDNASITIENPTQEHVEHFKGTDIVGTETKRHIQAKSHSLSEKKQETLSSRVSVKKVVSASKIIKEEEVLITKNRKLHTPEITRPNDVENSKHQPFTEHRDISAATTEKGDANIDFWSQIEARESLYMSQRKKVLKDFESAPVDNQTLIATEISGSKKILTPFVGKAESIVKKELTGIQVEPTKILRTDVERKPKSAEVSTVKQTVKTNSGQDAKSPEQIQNKQIAATILMDCSGGNSGGNDQPPIQNTAVTVAVAENVATAISTTKKTKVLPTTLKTISDTTTKPTKISKEANITTTTSATNLKTKTTTNTKKHPEAQTSKTTSGEVASKSSNKKKSPASKLKTGTTPKVSLPAAKSKIVLNAPVTPINADQFTAAAPTKKITSPTKTKNASPTAVNKLSADKNASDNVKCSKDPTMIAESMKISAKTITTTATTTTETKTTATKILTETNATTTSARATTESATGTTSTVAASVAVAVSDKSETRSSKNLSKFATVSNLAQFLFDVDADLEDYIPSSAENSDDSDSSSKYSSASGCENLSASMKKKLKQRRKMEKAAEKARFDPQKKVKIDATNKCYVKEEAPRYPLVATPRPLWKREKITYDDSEDSDSDASGSTEETDSDASTTSEFEDELHPLGAARSSSNTSKENSLIIRMSTSSNDSGFEGGTAPSSPKKMLECDVNCHKKCERLTANLCGVNQKLIVEALASVKRGVHDARDSPSTPPSFNPAYKIEATDESDETSYTYTQFQKSGRFTPPATVIPRFKNYSVDDFHFLAVLGKGSFGKVLLAELRDTTYYYAVKCLKKDVVLEDDDVDSTLIERKVLALGTKHPYLCHLFCTFQTESHLFFVMEYLNGGDLMFHIQESGRFTEERARFYGAEIISGLKFLHKKGIIYRDLKLDNVLLDYEGHVRIADFGMCKLQIYLDKTADSFCGTPDYMAPEIIKGEKYNQNVDWWSFGVLLYEMLIGQSPFSGCDEDELFWSICNEIPWFPVYISGEATSILRGLLEKDYTKRIGSQYSPAGDISDHIFFRPIDWKLLEKRQLVPPFKPHVKHPLDTQYFDRVFTRERVRLTPIDKEILQSMDQKQFLGFTYTNPHITLD